METTTITVKTMIMGTDKQTYEIKRIWDESKPHCLVLELYPTISIHTCSVGCMDLSTLHLLNHLYELGDYGSLSVCNLFSKICTDGKPSADELYVDEDNLEYISNLLDNVSEGTTLILAWGNSLVKHKETMKMKARLLGLIKEKGLEEQTKSITCAELENGKNNLFHPLFLGIRAKEPWQLQDVSVVDLLKEVSPGKDLSSKPEEKKKRRQKGTKAKDDAGL